MPRAETEFRGRVGSPVVPVGRLRRWWVNDHVHVVTWFLVAVCALAGYLTAHYRLRSDYLLSPAVEEAVSSAVARYQVTEDPETGRLALTFEGRTLGLLGVDGRDPGSIPGAYGLLTEARARLSAYDRRLDRYLRDILASFQRSPGRSGEVEAPLARFAERGFEAAAGQVVRIRTGALRPLIDIETNEVGARRLLRLLDGAQVYDTRVPAKVSEVDRLPAFIVPANVMPGVLEGVQRIEREVARREVRLGVERLESPTASQLSGSVCDGLAELRGPLGAFFGGRVAGFPGCPPARSGGVEVDRFSERLTARALAEVGFFWTAGPWLWIEVVLLTWLGVLTECLTRLGARYAGVDRRGRRWEPRETGRTFLKLAYAPAVSMVVVWTLMMTSTIEVGGSVWQGSGVAIVPVAFVLGLFPNLGFALLERLAQAVFRDTSVASPESSTERVFRREGGTPAVSPGAAPDFTAVRRRIARHGSAPLRGGQ